MMARGFECRRGTANQAERLCQLPPHDDRCAAVDLAVVSTNCQEKAKAKQPPERPDPTAADFVYGEDSSGRSSISGRPKAERAHAAGAVDPRRRLDGWRQVGLRHQCHPAVPRRGYFGGGDQLSLYLPGHGAKRRAAGEGLPARRGPGLQTLRSKAREWNLDPTRGALRADRPAPARSLWLAAPGPGRPAGERSDRAAVVALARLRRR